MSGLFAAVLATTWIATVDECATTKPPVMTAIRRAARELYEDPSATNSTRVTARLVREVLTPLSSAEALRTPHGVACLVQAATEIHRLASRDRERLMPALAAASSRLAGIAAEAPQESRAAYEAQQVTLGYYSNDGDWFESFPRPAPASSLVDEARESCGTGRFAACRPRDLEVLAMAHDPGAAGALERSIDRDPGIGADPEVIALQEWMQLEALYPDALERYAVALNPPFPEHSAAAGSAAQRLRTWALNELLGADPRSWSADAVAIAVLAAREADASSITDAAEAKAKAEKEAANGIIRITSDPFPRARCRGFNIGAASARCSLEQYLDVLSRMGIARAFELVKPASIERPSSKSDWVHFRGERELYTDEWTPSSGLSQDEFIAAEWARTDSSAPSPGLKAVNAAIARRLATRPQVSARRAAAPDPTVPSFDLAVPTIDRKAPCQSSMRSDATRYLLCPGDEHLFAPLPPSIGTKRE